MSVLVIIESKGKELGKSAFELATYGAKTASLIGSTCSSLVLGSTSNAQDLGSYGINEIHHSANIPDLFDSGVYAKVIAEASQKFGATVVVLRHNSTGKSLAGRLAIKMNAGLVSAANALPWENDGLEVSKGVYSGKASANIKIETENKIISVAGNSIQPEVSGEEGVVNNYEISWPESKVKLVERKMVSGDIPLPEAELVVSGGRGFKGPENWGILEELANVIGAATACSRPVADSDWRPHHEHVGQTGVAIKPNLYIGIGISGAIQHLAGVSSSKTIVVINKDPEAPFFKAADYGVVGDLFEVVPALTAAIKKLKSQ